MVWERGLKDFEDLPEASLPSCPLCGSSRVWRDGWRKLRNGGRVQRYLCRSCGYRFSQPKVELNILGQLPEGLHSKPNLGYAPELSPQEIHGFSPSQAW